jgi:hypothetical protein
MHTKNTGGHTFFTIDTFITNVSFDTHDSHVSRYAMVPETGAISVSDWGALAVANLKRGIDAAESSDGSTTRASREGALVYRLVLGPGGPVDLPAEKWSDKTVPGRGKLSPDQLHT